MNKSSVFESDLLTNDSLVPTFVFGHESQGLTRRAISGIYDLHQTSIGIVGIVLGLIVMLFMKKKSYDEIESGQS